jgi:hypothetical protein
MGLMEYCAGAGATRGAAAGAGACADIDGAVLLDACSVGTDGLRETGTRTWISRFRAECMQPLLL